jgi:hypothetical protein
MVVMPLFHRNGKSKLTVGKCNQHHNREKSLVQPACMLANLLCLLNKLTLPPLPTFVCILESTRLTPFTVQLNQVVFYPLTLFDHQKSKPVSQDIHLRRCGARPPEERSPAPILRHAFLSHTQTELQNFPFKTEV